MPERHRAGLILRAWVGSTWLTVPLAQAVMSRRLKAGKEDPDRWREKMGEASLPRPEGPLIWLHAVGVGEVLALPALAQRLMTLRPDLNILITSSTRTSAATLAPNLPAGVMHQFLPLDARPFINAFLDHWKPTVSVWAEQDLWPATVAATSDRGIPMVLVNGRMNDAAMKSRRKLRGLFRDLYSRFSFIGVQEERTAANFVALGAPADRVHVTGSLKAAAKPLADQPERREELQAALKDRRVWIAASTHPGEETIVAEAHADLLRHDPSACLIVAPRDPARGAEVVEILAARGVGADLLPADNRLPGRSPAYVVGRIGQLGLWYRLADTAFVGGSLCDVGGHNPYEPARLDCAILHGPNVANFAQDYAAFHVADAAREVTDSRSLTEALLSPDLAQMRVAAQAVAQRGENSLNEVADAILAQMDG